MALMHPPSLKPLNSRRNGSRARKQIPFFQPRRPFLSIFPEECQQIQLPKITDSRGSLSFIEGERHIPFKIRSAYWISDIAGTMTPKENPNEGRQEFIIPLSGRVEVTYDNGWVKKRLCLDRPDRGLYVPNSARRHLKTLPAKGVNNAIVLVLTSAPSQRKDSFTNGSLKVEKIQ